MQCEIRGTRKEASPLYRLRPRRPKFRKKGSGNNKTRGTSCALLHARKKTGPRKKGVNDGPAKGDTFRFGSARECIFFLSLSPDRFTISSCFSARRIVRIRESRVACRGTRAPVTAARASRGCTYVTTNITAYRGSIKRQRELWKGRTLERRSGSLSLTSDASLLPCITIYEDLYLISSRNSLFIAPFA